MHVRWTVIVVGLLCVIGSNPLAAQDKALSATDAWVAEPAGEATSAMAYAVIENPSMYEVFVVKVAAEGAASAEITEAARPVAELPVPAYGSAVLEPGGVHILLKGLKQPLKAGDHVSLTLTTDLGVAITVDAPVRKP